MRGGVQRAGNSLYDDSPSATGTKNRALNLFLQMFALLVCFGVPALVTGIAPVSYIQFQREGERVTFQAKTCFYFLIPYKTVTLDPVVSVGRDTIAGSVTRYRRTGQRDKEVEAETQGFLVVRGKEEQEVQVPVTPHNLEAVVEKSRAFLTEGTAVPATSRELKMFVVANWKFSVLCGGLAMLLPVLVVACFGIELVRRVLGRGKTSGRERSA